MKNFFPIYVSAWTLSVFIFALYPCLLCQLHLHSQFHHHHLNVLMYYIHMNSWFMCKDHMFFTSQGTATVSEALQNRIPTSARMLESVLPLRCVLPYFIEAFCYADLKFLSMPHSWKYFSTHDASCIGMLAGSFKFLKKLLVVHMNSIVQCCHFPPSHYVNHTY